MSTLKWKVFCVYEKFSFLLFDKISYKKSFHVPFMGVESVATNKSLWYNAHYHNVVCGVVPFGVGVLRWTVKEFVHRRQKVLGGITATP